MKEQETNFEQKVITHEKYRQHSKECIWRQWGHFYMVFNVYDSKGGARVALYWISFDSEETVSKVLGTEVIIICCLDEYRWHGTGRIGFAFIAVISKWHI